MIDIRVLYITIAVSLTLILLLYGMLYHALKANQKWINHYEDLRQKFANHIGVCPEYKKVKNKENWMVINGIK